jgi:hypothetical protein
MNKIFCLIVLFLATVSGFGQAGPAQSGLQAPVQPTIPATINGTTYYVDNVAGSDANNGTSTITPWKTIAHVNSQSFSSGSQILFYSQDIWHEQLNVTWSNVSFGAYGPQRNCQVSFLLAVTCLNMPIIDGSDVVSGWVLVTGTTYEAPYTSTVVKGFVDSLYFQQTPLTLETSLANVEANTGSIYANGTYVYINLLAGDSPANHVIEVTGSRFGGIFVQNGTTNITNVTINGLEIIRADVCGICVDAYDEAQDTGINITNNVLFNIGDTVLTQNATGNGQYGGIILESSVLQGSSNGNTIIGNYIGQMDTIPANLNYGFAGISALGQNGTVIRGNKVATVYGEGINVSDEYTTSCTGVYVQGNEITNMEGGIYNLGCQYTTITGNNIHNGKGNGVEDGGCFDTGNSDCNNTNTFIGYNTIHDLVSGYNFELYNGIDVNYAYNGIAIGNTVYAVAADDMTLEGYTLGLSSSGWLVENNIFDSSANLNPATNVCCQGQPMLIINFATPGLVMKGNSFVWNATTNYIIYNGSSALDTAHAYTQAAFDQVCPGCETIGANGQFQTLNVNVPPSFSQGSQVGTPLQALGSIGRYNSGPTVLPATTGANGILSTANGGTGLSGRISALTSASSNIVATTLATAGKTGIALPPLPINTTGEAHCFVIWEQLTAASTVTFALENSVAPASEAVGTLMSNDSATVNAFDYTTNTTGNTPVAITGTNTTAAASTAYWMEANITVANGAVAPLVISLVGYTGSASDALVAEGGSYCAWL